MRAVINILQFTILAVDILNLIVSIVQVRFIFNINISILFILILIFTKQTTKNTFQAILISGNRKESSSDQEYSG